MVTLHSLWMGFEVFLTPGNLLVAVGGIFLGAVVGVLPGLGVANGVAILIPLTFTMSPNSAIILLAAIYWGGLFGGVITSILFNIPGEPWSVATTFDGYPMAKKGQAGKALTAAFCSHLVGAVFATLMLTFFAPVVAEFSLRFGPPEMFAVMMLTFSALVGLVGKSAVKTTASVLLGLLLAAVGLDIITGGLRLTFGYAGLMGGFNFLVVVIGLFGIGELFLSVEEGLRLDGLRANLSLRTIRETIREMPRYWRTLLRGAIIGCWMGIKPGGATPASFMSYGFAKQFSRHPEDFGTGTIEGVIAPEVAAHAAGVSAMLPMITLGIPGSPTAAVMLGGLMIWGLQPGPMLFKEHPDFVWGLIASIWASNALGVLIVLAFVPLFVAILRTPFEILMPTIVFLCAVGAYSVSNRMADIWYMLVFGVVGYVMKKLEYPLAPLVLALVLGDMAESAFRQSLVMSQGSFAIFINQPIAGVLNGGAIVLFLWPGLRAILAWWRRRSAPPPLAAAPAASARQRD